MGNDYRRKKDDGEYLMELLADIIGDLTPDERSAIGEFKPETDYWQLPHEFPIEQRARLPGPEQFPSWQRLLSSEDEVASKEMTIGYMNIVRKIRYAIWKRGLAPPP